MNISIKKQKEIAIEMWQYIKSRIENDIPLHDITLAKQKWLRLNYPEIHWKCECILCDIYMHPYIVDDCYHGLTCPDCPLSKKYKDSASYGCAIDDDTPWSRITNYDVDGKTAIEACDEIIEAIKSVPEAIYEIGTVHVV